MIDRQKLHECSRKEEKMDNNTGNNMNQENQNGNATTSGAAVNNSGYTNGDSGSHENRTQENGQGRNYNDYRNQNYGNSNQGNSNQGTPNYGSQNYRNTNYNDNPIKKLYRSVNSRMLCGVCGGLANYFRCDPTIVRLLLVFLAFCSCGTALIAYIVMAIVIPETPFNE